MVDLILWFSWLTKIHEIFHKKAMNPQNILHFLLTSIDGETNNMMHAVSAYMSGVILVFLNSTHVILSVALVLSMALLKFLHPMPMQLQCFN